MILPNEQQPEWRMVAGTPRARRRYLTEAYVKNPTGVGSSCWIVSEAFSAEQIRRDLIRELGAGVLSPGVRTVSQFVDSVLAGTEEDFHPLNRVKKRRLIETLVRRSERRRSFQPFLPLRESQGLIDFLEARFVDLRRRELTAEAATERLLQTDGMIGGALATLYKDYLDALDKHRLLDAEGRCALAAASLARGDHSYAIAVIDLARFPSPIEQRLLAALASASNEFVVAAPGDGLALGESPDTSRLPAAVACREGWQALLSEGDPRIVEAESEATPWDLAHARIRLYSDNAGPPRAPSQNHAIEVVAGGDTTDELRRVARRIKDLLLQGERPEEIVVAARRPHLHADRVVSAFSEFGLPLASSTPMRLSAAELIGALIDLLRLAGSDWRFDRLLRVVGRRDLSTVCQQENERVAAEWFTRELQAPSGRDYLLRQARSLAARAESAGSEATTLEATAALALPVFTRLNDSLEQLPDQASPLEWFDAAITLLARLGYRSSEDSSEKQLDQAARDALEQALADLEALTRRAGSGRASSLSRDDLLGSLQAWSTRIPAAKAGSREGRVLFTGAETASGLSCAHLFLIGLSESSFSGQADTSLADASARSTEEEMLLFYELVSTPSDSLTLSYPALDDKAQPLPPSPLVAEVERLFPSGSLRGETRLLEPVDREGEPRTPREWRLRSVARSLSGDASGLRACLSGPLGFPLRGGLEAVAARATGNAFGPYEGMLGRDTLAILGTRFGGDRLWSPTQLELYATCPFKFFARHVLGAEPVGELALEVDYRRRGSLVHDALAKFCVELSGRLAAGESLGERDPEEIRRLLSEAIQSMALSDRLPPHEASLARIEARQATDWATEYASQQADYEKTWRDLDRPLTPSHFEARFGPTRRADEEEDPLSTDKPLEMRLDDKQTLRLMGRIDRIDVGRLEGHEVFTVIDYKTAKKVQTSDEMLLLGKQLQLALYTLAAQEVLLPGSKPLAAGYWAVQNKGFVGLEKKPLHLQENGELVPSEEWSETVKRLPSTLSRIVNGVREAAFPMENSDHDCGARCEFRTVCRVAQARSLGKRPGESARRGEEDPS